LIPINSEQELKNLKKQHGNRLFTFKKESVEIIQSFNEEKCQKIGQLFQRLQFIFIVESSATIKNPSDALMLDFFINMEIAKLLDKPPWINKKGKIINNTVTLKEFKDIAEINEIIEKNDDKIDKIITFRNKSLAHSDFDRSTIEVLPVMDYLDMLREFSDILFKILYFISESKKDELKGHNILFEISKRIASMKSFYSNESNLNKQLIFQEVTKET